MKIFVIDWETFWDQEYSVSKMTTESYIRDERFFDHLVGILETDGTKILSQKYFLHHQIAQALADIRIYENAAVAHHAHFDGLIMSHHYGALPKVWFDTLSMSRPIDGAEVGGSLDALSKKYGLPPKGMEAQNTKGIRHLDPLQLRNLGLYCLGDCRNTFELFKIYWAQLPKNELKMIDACVRMFTEPQLLLNSHILEEELEEMRFNKADLMLAADASKDTLMSAEKFANRLRTLGVDPPVKQSVKGNKIYAFAKTDMVMEWMANEHPDRRVRALCAARIGVKSTIGETRAQSLLEMSRRGPACVYIKYAGAQQTLRMSGGDGTNWQNLQKRGRIREAVEAPEGHVILVGDESQIEHRVLITLAGQWDAIERMEAFDRGEGTDPYCYLASRIYSMEITPDMEKPRQLGKIGTLGLGYQMGVNKFVETARIWGVDVDHKLGQTTVSTFREVYDCVVRLWQIAQNAIPLMAEPHMQPFYLDEHQLLRVEHQKIVLPNGTTLRYPNLKLRLVNGEKQWVFTQKGETKTIYGGKVVENVTQALANLIMKEVTVPVAQYYPVKLHSHDELGALVKIGEEEEAKRYVYACMVERRKWWPALPLAAKVKFGRNYKEAK